MAYGIKYVHLTLLCNLFEELTTFFTKTENGVE